MNVFISWSGAKSREVATALREWLLLLFPSSEPWVASDLPAGVEWNQEITHHLQLSRIGIVCLTDENKDSPWLLFEAGALSRAGKLVLYLVGLEPREIAGPLAQFEATQANRNGTWRLIAALNKEAEEQVAEELLLKEFDLRWPELERVLLSASGPRIETVSILCADIVGSTHLLATAGDLAFRKSLQEFFALARELLRTHKGRTIKFIGDAFMATFPQANYALMFAEELQNSLAQQSIVIAGEPLTVRIGIHSGVVQLTPTSYGDDDIIGRAVNLAARLTSKAGPGEIVISGDALDQLSIERKSLLGRREKAEVKGFANLVELVRYTPAGVRKA